LQDLATGLKNRVAEDAIVFAQQRLQRQLRQDRRKCLAQRGNEGLDNSGDWRQVTHGGSGGGVWFGYRHGVGVHYHAQRQFLFTLAFHLQNCAP
jgi:hypothetical protein